MVQELYINGQQVDLDQSTEVTLEYKSNILGDISKIEGSHSYSITLPKTRRNLRILQDPGNPARNASTVRRYLNARYYRNGIDLFGDCRAVILEVSADGIDIALTMQGLRSLATWSEAGKGIKDLFTNDEFIPWQSVTAYESMLSQGRGIARMYTGVNVEDVTNVFYPPAISLHTLFTKIMSATGVQNYSMPATIQQDMRTFYVPFTGITAARFEARNEAGTIETGNQTEPARDAVHLKFSNFNRTPEGWVDSSEAFAIPSGADTFRMGLSAEMPAGTFKTSGTAYFRIMGSSGSGDIELYTKVIRVESDGSAIVTFGFEEAVDVKGASWVWAEVSNTQNGTHRAGRDSSFIYVFQGKQAERGEDLLIGRNLPDLKQLDVLKFICNYYGLAIVPVGIDGLSFVPYSVLTSGKAGATDWSDKLTGDSPDGQRGKVGFALSDFAQRNLIKWTEDDLPYIPADGVLTVDDSTLQAEKTLVTLPFAASDIDQYPIFSAEYDEDTETYDVSVNGLKPRIFRLRDLNGSAILTFTADMQLPARIQEYYKEYQDIIRQPITQKVECRLDERDLKNLDFTRPVYFRQFGQYYAVDSVRTSNNTDICEIKIIQI